MFGLKYNKEMLRNGFVVFFSVISSLNTAFAQGEGNNYIADALKMLLTVRTVDCDIRIETLVDGKEYIAQGSYQEQSLPNSIGNGFLRSMYRLEIYFSMITPTATNGSDPNRMTLVCHPSEEREKNKIERYTSIEGIKSFSTIDLTKLEERLKLADKEVFFAQISEVRNLGGLSGTIRQISRFYEFTAPTLENIQDKEPIPALKLTGSLRSIYYKELLKRFGGLDKKGEHPADLPTDIEIWIGRHNDFPYQIRYLRRTSEKSDQKGLLFQETFSDVKINGEPVPAAKFAPLNVPEDFFNVQDDTENFLRSLGI